GRSAAVVGARTHRIRWLATGSSYRFELPVRATGSTGGESMGDRVARRGPRGATRAATTLVSWVALPPSKETSAVVCRGLVKKYERGPVALDGLDLEVLV